MGRFRLSNRMRLTQAVLRKAVLANGPIAKPKGTCGNGPKVGGDLLRNAMFCATACFAVYYYSRLPVSWGAVDKLLHSDYWGKYDRLRERGVIQIGSDPLYSEPASWQHGREKFMERQTRKREIIQEHIDEYNLKVGKHGYETPFNVYQA